MSLLTMDDFKGHPMNLNCSALEALLEVARVASPKKPSHFDPRKPTSLKRSYTTIFDNEDWDLSKKHQGKKKLKKQQQSSQATSVVPPELPKEFKKKIEEMGGLELTLLIQKSWYVTDLSSQHNRLSLPLNQVKNPHFLREQESLLLMKKNQALDVILIEPSLHTRNIVFGKWDFRKSSSYVLRSCWIKVANANGLRVNDVVQVWSFRVERQLCMALVKVSPSN